MSLVMTVSVTKNKSIPSNQRQITFNSSVHSKKHQNRMIRACHRLQLPRTLLSSMIRWCLRKVKTKNAARSDISWIWRAQSEKQTNLQKKRFYQQNWETHLRIMPATFIWKACLIKTDKTCKSTQVIKIILQLRMLSHHQVVCFLCWTSRLATTAVSKELHGIISYTLRASSPPKTLSSPSRVIV